MDRSFRHLAHGLVGIVALLLASAALADPPARVARLSYITGRVSFSPAAETEAWVQARLNRPLYIGDRLWADNGARAELELGTATLRLAPRTSVTVLNIDDRITQLQLAEGRLNVRVRSLQRDETFEIDTPNLAFVVTSPGNYRVEVDASGNATVVAVRDGRGEVYGEGASYLVNTGQWYKFYGTDLDNDYARVAALDEFDRWTQTRDARYDRSVSARYVSRATIGFSDLDDYGTWNTVADYGAVWYPRNIPAEWAPYRNGHWAWIDPWGWTWVDDAPWGFAPFHYGRWARISDRWGWVPGPVDVRPVYAPALVAFVGGNNFTVTVASGGAARGIGWFPLAPGEVYRPSYRVSRDYFTEINVTNTRINTTYVTNVYNNPPAVGEVRYRNRATANAITAVPVTAFVESRPVARAVIPAASRTVETASVIAMPTVAPVRASVVGAAPPAQVKPPVVAQQRQAVAKTAPPTSVPVFTAQDPGANRGNGVDANTARAPQGTAAPLRERVKVVAPSRPTQSGATAEHRGAPAGTPSTGGGLGAAPGATPGAPAKAAAPGVPPAAEATPNDGRRGRPDRTAAPGATSAPAGTAAGAPNTPPTAAAPVPGAAPATPDAAAPSANRGRGRPDRTAAPSPSNAPGAPGNAVPAPNAVAPGQGGGLGTPAPVRRQDGAPAGNAAAPATTAAPGAAAPSAPASQRGEQQRARDRQQEGAPANGGRPTRARPDGAPSNPPRGASDPATAPAAAPVPPPARAPESNVAPRRDSPRDERDSQRGPGAGAPRNAPPAASGGAQDRGAPPAAAAPPEPRGRANGRRGDAPARAEPPPAAQPRVEPPAAAPAARLQPPAAAPAAAPAPAAGTPAPARGEAERAARRKQQEEQDKARQEERAREKEANKKKEKE